MTKKGNWLLSSFFCDEETAKALSTPCLFCTAALFVHYELLMLLEVQFFLEDTRFGRSVCFFVQGALQKM